MYESRLKQSFSFGVNTRMVAMVTDGEKFYTLGTEKSKTNHACFFFLQASVIDFMCFVMRTYFLV